MWRRAWYEHQNLRDERAEAFTSYLRAGVHTCADHTDHPHHGADQPEDDRVERPEPAVGSPASRQRLVRAPALQPEGQGKRQFASDVKYLWGLWKRIDRRAARADAPALIHKDMELTTGLIRDLFR